VYGADYFIRLWVNGALIADVPSQGGAAIRDRFEQPVPLRAGWNEIRVKLASGTYGNGFWMAVSDPGDLRVDARGRPR
jgi:beta-galactosidase